jgi:hypothetical protein
MLKIHAISAPFPGSREQGLRWALDRASRRPELFKGPDVQFVCPRAAILVRQIPEGIRDCVRLE